MPPGAHVDLGWLSGLVRQTLRLPEDAPVADATLVSLGAESMQAIALQYQILAGTGADVAVQDLLGDHTVAELAASLPDAADAGEPDPGESASGAALVKEEVAP